MLLFLSWHVFLQLTCGSQNDQPSPESWSLGLWSPWETPAHIHKQAISTSPVLIPKATHAFGGWLASNDLPLGWLWILVSRGHLRYSLPHCFFLSKGQWYEMHIEKKFTTENYYFKIKLHLHINDHYCYLYQISNEKNQHLSLVLFSFRKKIEI